METFFLACIGIGVGVLALQILAGLVGFGDHHLHLGHTDVGAAVAGEGLQLLSVRSIAAALAVFGAFGLWLDGFLPGWMAAGSALVPAFLAALGTALVMRFLVRMETDGSLRLEEAVGATGRVYLTIPGAEQATGLVHIPVQGRSIELRAITREKEPLKTGASVLVISVDTESETVEVVSTHNVEGLPS